MFLYFDTFLFLFSKNVGYQGWNSQNACQKSKQRRPWPDRFFRSSLIWVCPVCVGFCGTQLLFKILEHLLQLLIFTQICWIASCRSWRLPTPHLPGWKETDHTWKRNLVIICSHGNTTCWRICRIFIQISSHIWLTWKISDKYLWCFTRKFSGDNELSTQKAAHWLVDSIQWGREWQSKEY